MAKGHGEKLTRKQQQAVAALIQHATIRAAAAAVPVHERTLREWMRAPAFATAYRRARRELLDVAVGRIQVATGTAVDTLLGVAQNGEKDSDRVRAAIAVLELAFRGQADAELLHGERPADDGPPMGTSEVVNLLATRLREIDQAELPTGEKARLSTTLADSLLRAISVDVLDKRLEALHGVLCARREQS